MRDGQPWFIAKDVCDALGIENSRDAVRSLRDHERNTVAIPDGKRGNPNKQLVNESGFYKLVLKSRKPEARKFQDWVTGVVLPAIRKDGGYILGEEKVATSGRRISPCAPRPSIIQASPAPASLPWSESPPRQLPTLEQAARGSLPRPGASSSSSPPYTAWSRRPVL